MAALVPLSTSGALAIDRFRTESVPAEKGTARFVVDLDAGAPRAGTPGRRRPLTAPPPSPAVKVVTTLGSL
ncbi:hypothetical protein ACFV19_30660, partial [Streptomyces griseoluteus]|uniref:hypothetical protein n=1 Tax=Streptomyces griseoluteus TaxID=29306 RepID=UPI0036D0BCBA